MKKYNFAIITLVSTLTGACAMGTTSKNDFAVADTSEPSTTQNSPSNSTETASSSNSSSASATSTTSSGGTSQESSADSGSGGSGGGEENLGGFGGANTGHPGADTSSTASTGGAGGSENPPPPPPQPLSGCLDDIDVLGEAFWSRKDIVFCGTANKQLPVNHAAAKAMCAPGWHLCSHQEFADRNDLCPAHQETFSALLDDGEDCMMHDSGDVCPNCWQCNDDFVRPGYTGSCQGVQSQTAFSTRSRVQDSSGPAPHGVLCCL